MNLKISKKIRSLLEVIACFFLMALSSNIFSLIANIFDADGLWVGIASYVLSAAVVLLYVVKIEKKPVSYIGLKKPTFLDIPKGLLLGLGMFLVQQIPLLLMKMDYSI